MNTYNEKEYLLKKYKEDNLNSDGDYNPWINPEYNYIPKCQCCEEGFINFKKDLELILSLPGYKQKIDWQHPKSCLWYDYYIIKIKDLCPNIKIVRNNK